VRRRSEIRLTKDPLPPVESCAWMVAYLAGHNLWKTFQLCDACRTAPARTDGESQFLVLACFDPLWPILIFAVA
jgi:hypothetical protein